ncbi:P-loop containing nucleoside triphosphate hydrolase protein [Mycena crocata]|nr:P-loop containing nucleoside triphosphate hydrolase protein [Mycena crocata]
MFWPGKLTLTSITIQRNYSGLSNALQRLFWTCKGIGKCVADIEALYNAAEIPNRITDGDVAYPPSDTSNGMALEFRNVSFQYPSGQSKGNALRNVSFSIPAGNLVVIVGTNGSGKSTIIKLLTRMYDVASGEIHVDGLPIQRYQIAQLCEAQATLAQDHHLFPLTLTENIGIGYPQRLQDDKAMITKAAEDGGASVVLDKLEHGLDTNLKSRLSELQKKGSNLSGMRIGCIFSNLLLIRDSGGEKQRIVASRTFMRLRTGNIKLLCFDEPSSELDPPGEFELFERLRATAAGKTMIFVTHRFGHLTKYADTIICMKEGRVAEIGTHKDLMGSNGEYAALYNVQGRLSVTRSRCCSNWSFD